MQVIVSLEHRFDRTPDGAVWTSGINAHRFFTRYLKVFEGVKVLARVRDVASVPADWTRSDGPGVTFVPVPYYLGPWQYLMRASKVATAVRAAVQRDDAVIMRVGSHIAGCLEPALHHRGHPYGLEVVGDPYDVFGPGAVRHWLSPFFRWWFTRQLRTQCARAIGVAYVTKRVLQQRYPSAAYSVGMSDVEIPHDALVAARDVFITHYSSIELAEEDSVATFRTAPQRRKRLRLITIGSLAQMYKGTDVLIRAAAKCLAAGMDFDLAIVGDGKCRRELEQLAEDLGISRHVHFLGQLPAGEAVREQLDKADLFVLPSRCEGLPRAMIEAMARALPCIGSAVGGIPELLVDEHMTPPGDVVALAAKIREVLDSPARMSAMSVRNLAIAQEYRDGILDERRTAFYEHIRRSTAEWLVRTSASERHDHESQDHRLRHEQYVRRSPVSPRSSVERARARV